MTKYADSVVLFVVDGMRPDGLRKSSTPVMDELVRAGASSFDAQTVMPSITLPCIASLFLGTPPDIHGTTTNTWNHSSQTTTSLFSAVRSESRKTASFYNWEPLRDLAPAGSLDMAVYMANSHDAGGAGDRLIAEMAADSIRREKFALTFVYLGYVDTVGHSFGFMSDEYLGAIAAADTSVGVVLDALSRDTAVVVLADHGGHEKTHGTECEEDMTIPVILSGAGIPEGHSVDGGLCIIDVAPTILRFLRLDCPAEWTGKPLFV